VSGVGAYKKTDKVWERIGRLKEKYASVNKYYEITVLEKNKGIASCLVFQRKEESHLGLLAYWIVSTIRYQLKQQGIHHDRSEIVRIMNTQKSVTATVENHHGQTFPLLK
jgi:hypothetical protein